MADPNENLGVGGGMPPLGPVGSLEAEEKALKKGKGRMLAGMIVAAIAAVAFLVWYMSSGGEDAYGTFGRNINGYDQQYFDQFWGCSLQGVDLRNIRTNDDLRGEIHERAARGGPRYAAHVRERCMPKLAEMEPKLTALIPPEDMAAKLTELNETVQRLRAAWGDFAGYLENLEGGYDEDDADEKVGQIARAWYDYSRTHNELNRSVREKLGR